MKIVLAVVAALAAGALAACTPTAPATNPADPSAVAKPSSTTSDDSSDDGDLAGYPEYTIICGEGDEVIKVDPDTPATREAAKKKCAKAAGELENAPWPSGWHPTTLPTGG